MKTKYLDQFFTLFVNYGIQWWNDRDLSLPEEAKLATQNYFDKTDMFKQFINEKVENSELVLDEKGSIQASIFYRMYQEWYRNTKNLNISLEDFKEQACKDFISKRTKLYIIYQGIRMINEEDNTQD